jgi:hypothetical protein
MPFARLIVAASLLVSCPAVPMTTGTSALPEQDPITFIQYPLVHQVICLEGKGTAFRVGPRHFLSVAHVTGLHGCSVDGQPIAVTEQDKGRDFSQFDADLPSERKLEINCTGFVPGQWYWAAGYAEGAPFQTELAVYATFAKDPSGKRVLIGPRAVIPGMSGGPIFDASGKVVGTVNAYYAGTGISLSRELKDTSACGGNIA